MDNTKEYYRRYFEIEAEEKEEYTSKQKRYILSLENQLRDCWATKDISKIKSMTELIEEEKKNLEDDKFKMIADDTLEKHRAIYLGTWSAWDNGYKLSSDDVAAILSQSAQWVTRELAEQLDYISLIKPHIFFSMNFMFNVMDQQILSKKKYLYSSDSFFTMLLNNLKIVNEKVPLNIPELSEDEKEMAIQYIRELEEGASNESMVDDKIVSKILRKEIVLMNISALKQQILKSQILLNAERMQKKLYLGVKLGIVNKDSKKAQEYLISKYIKDEERNIKNITTIYNQQVYRFLDSNKHTKYHLYFSDDKEPLVLYSLGSLHDNSTDGQFYIMRNAYYECIEDDILSKVKIQKKDNIINITDRLK